MKLELVFSLYLVFTLYGDTTYGQANFLIANDVPLSDINAPIYDAEGNPLEGYDYLVELWGGASPDSLAPALDVNHGFTREIVPLSAGGYFLSTAGSISIPDVQPYGYAWLQVRAWDASLGATYEEVAALGIGGYGASALFYTQGNDPTKIPPDLPAPLIGLESFSLLPIIPEPSASALVALGGAVLWWSRRRSSPR